MPRRSTTSAAAASAAALLALSGPAAGAFSPSLSPPRPSSAASFLHRGAAAPLQLDGAIGADCGQADGDEGHTVTVTYEGRSALVHVEPSESILSALERTGAADALCLSEVPSECRRGNCLTCTGRVVAGPPSSLRRDGDGLTPSVAEDLEAHGLALLCSAGVGGDGLIIELGRNGEAWELSYRARFESDDDTELVNFPS